MAVTFAYQKPLIPSAFHGDSCPNMGPAAFWVISSVCDNDSGLCFCCPQKIFHLGRGRLLAKNEKGTGKPKVRKYAVSGHRWVSRGKGKSRRLEEWADPGTKVREGGQRAGQGKPELQPPLPLPVAHCPGQMCQMNSNQAWNLPPCQQLR